MWGGKGALASARRRQITYIECKIVTTSIYFQCIMWHISRIVLLFHSSGLAHGVVAVHGDEVDARVGGQVALVVAVGQVHPEAVGPHPHQLLLFAIVH